MQSIWISSPRNKIHHRLKPSRVWKIESTRDGVGPQIGSVVLLTRWAGFLAETVREVAPLSNLGRTRGMFLALALPFAMSILRVLPLKESKQDPSQRFFPVLVSRKVQHSAQLHLSSELYSPSINRHRLLILAHQFSQYLMILQHKWNRRWLTFRQL